jgi:hypothetical protein
MNAHVDEFNDPAQPNLQEVLDRALGEKAIPQGRVAGARAAVAAFARLMQRSPGELPAH